MNFGECDELRSSFSPAVSRHITGCCISTEETIVSEERGWKDFIRFLAVKVNPSVLRTPPLYFAVQNTEEEV